MQRKKIAIVVSAMNLGGAQRVVSVLSDHWSKNGYDVSLISTFTGKDISHYEVNESIRLLHLKEYKYFYGNRFLNLIWKLMQLRKIFVHHNPDIIISFLTRVNIASALATFGLKKRLVISERTWTPFASLNKKFYWFYRIVFSNVENIIVQTDQSKKWLQKNFNNCKVRVIPNPVSYPLPIQKEQYINPNKFIFANKKIILASGRLHKFKQFDLLIKAYSRICDYYLDWDLVILGEGEDRIRLQSLIDSNKIRQRVHMPGSVGNIADWYHAADIFVLSSLVEGFPNVLLEAMSHGLPCVSFDCNTGPKEMIEHNVNGILVSPIADVEGLQVAMKKLIENPELRKNISNQAVDIRNRYSKNNIMKMWDEILEK